MEGNQRTISNLTALFVKTTYLLLPHHQGVLMFSRLASWFKGPVVT